MSASLWLSWQPSVSVSAADDGAVVEAPGARVALRPIAPEIVAAMRRLSPPGEDRERLADSVLAGGSFHSLARWFYHLGQLSRRGLIRRSLYADGRLVATVVPLGLMPDSPAGPHALPGARPAGGQSSRVDLAGRVDLEGHGSNGEPAAGYVLSRFAYLRREGRELVAESPLAHVRLVLHEPSAAALVASLAVPATAAELAKRGAASAPATVAALLELLVESNFVERTGDGARRCAQEQTELAALDTWEFHDLLFHARSRRGRSDAGFGGTCRLAQFPPPPALKPPAARPCVELERPDLDRLRRDDPPLALVQERRRSLRSYGPQPIGADQLAEFLYRVARVTGRGQSELPTPSGAISLDVALRPFPAGGGLYELEFYPVVQSCRDLAAGLYRYDPLHHRLEQVCEKTDDVASLLGEAAASASMDAAHVQVVIVLAARFARVAWKYESIAYSLILKHVGVAYQTMYLAATAMGLAPCALGCGDSDLFARAAGTDYYAETSVGEFLLGSGVNAHADA